MKISKGTIDVLKNYSTVNPSVLVKAGNAISTMAATKTILSSAVVEETFPVDFAVYELSRFLGVISLFEDPDFDFQENSVTISGGSHSVRYNYAEASMIITPPERELKLPEDGLVTTDVSWIDFTKVMRGASILQKPEVQFRVEDGRVFLEAVDMKNMKGDNYSIELEPVPVGSGTYVFKIENLKLIEGDYTIELSPQGMAKFTNKNRQIHYFIALQTT